MLQRVRVDGDIFEDAPHVDVDIVFTDKKVCVLKKYPATCRRGLGLKIRCC